MKHFYIVKISSFLLFFVIGAIIFMISLVCGVIHAVPASSAPSETPYVVIIDAGHGGEDGGAIGANQALEKDINLAIARYIKEELIHSGLSVEMIRETDTAVGDLSLPTVSERKRSDIQYRAEYVEQHDNCILVSIHQNFFEQSQYTGAQMFYSKTNPNSILLAESIRKSIVGTLQPENHRENKAADGIYLLEHVESPAVLVECGFISNPNEAALLCDPQYQKRMGLAISEGIIHYVMGE